MQKVAVRVHSRLASKKTLKLATASTSMKSTPTEFDVKSECMVPCADS